MLKKLTLQELTDLTGPDGIDPVRYCEAVGYKGPLPLPIPGEGRIVGIFPDRFEGKKWCDTRFWIVRDQGNARMLYVLVRDERWEPCDWAKLDSYDDPFWCQTSLVMVRVA